jgi:hypothetical protein
MERLVRELRPDLADIKIGIVWNINGWRPDADGIRTEGKVVKNSETERQRTGIDWDIQISEPIWKALDGTGKERLVFHHLEHIQICHDKDGGVMLDDKDRPVTRARRHDIAEHRSVLERYGPPKQISQTEIADADRGLLKIAEQKGGVAGTATNTDGGPPEQVKPGLRIPDGETYSETFTIKCKGMKRAGVDVKIHGEGGGPRAEWSARLGNYSGDGKISLCPSRSACLEVLKNSIFTWLNELAFSGTADQKRTMQRRREQMRDQVTATLDKLIEDARFEEPPQGGAPNVKPEIEDEEEDEFDREVAEDEESQ